MSKTAWTLEESRAWARETVDRLLMEAQVTGQEEPRVRWWVEDGVLCGLDTEALKCIRVEGEGR